MYVAGLTTSIFLFIVAVEEHYKDAGELLRARTAAMLKTIFLFSVLL
jgi:hypothetical protein